MPSFGKAIISFLKDWILPLSMSGGILLYLIYHWTPALHSIGPTVNSFATTAQPVLIFAMLFLQFNKISPHDLRLRWWHLAILLFQAFFFCGGALLVSIIPDGNMRLLAEAGMLCFITPTATAAGVITEKLGGNLSDTMTYVVLSNCLAALLIPSVVPAIHPLPGQSFLPEMMSILGRVFPMLILPCIAAWIVRYTMKKVQVFLMRYTGMAFYLWSISLVISLALTTRSLLLSHISLNFALVIGLVSLVCCCFQFWAGRKIGNRWNPSTGVTAGQAFGQKNTVFQIWLGYTFLSPETSIGGGFYCIWHNLVNSWELYRRKRMTFLPPSE